MPLYDNSPFVLHETCARAWRHIHDDVIKWKHFPRNWPFVRGIHRSPVNSPHKGQWRGVLMFTLICAPIYGWVNALEAGDLRRYRPHYDVIVMLSTKGINSRIALAFRYEAGPWFNIKISSYQSRKSYRGDNTVIKPSYRRNGIPYTGKMASLYWTNHHLFNNKL